MDDVVKYDGFEFCLRSLYQGEVALMCRTSCGHTWSVVSFSDRGVYRFPDLPSPDSEKLPFPVERGRIKLLHNSFDSDSKVQYEGNTNKKVIKIAEYGNHGIQVQAYSDTGRWVPIVQITDGGMYMWISEQHRKIGFPVNIRGAVLLVK